MTVFHQVLSEEDPNLDTLNRVSPVVLSPEQIKVLRMVQQSRNVFFTGSAGLFLFC